MKKFIFVLSFAAFSLCFLGTLKAKAATYYIDFQGGSDTNAGNSINTPWKRHPYMAGFSGSYSHSAGDKFIFKGGVTWPRSAFQLSIVAGGSSNSNRDYYGVDQAWYAGNSWSRPVFDFEYTVIGSGGIQSSAGVLFDRVGFITFDNIELKRFMVPRGGWGINGNLGTISVYYSSHITIQNCYIHDWELERPINPGDDSGWNGGICKYPAANPGVLITRCTLNQAGTVLKTGCAICGDGEFSHNTIYEVMNGILGGGIIHDNHIYNTRDATDSECHENALEVFGDSTIYNNIIHDIWAGAMSINVWDTTGGAYLFYNNVIFNGGYNVPIVLDAGTNQPISAQIYNNTLMHQACIRNQSPIAVGSLSIRNNLCIATASFCYQQPSGRCGSVNNLSMSNNLTISPSEAAAQGFFSSNNYAPTKSLAGSVNTGISLANVFTFDINNITRPQGSAWDIGAYEYNGAIISTPTPTPNLSPTAMPTPIPTTRQSDLNNDNYVDVIDLGILLSNWNSASRPTADINQDGRVDVIDLGILLSSWS